MVKLLFMNKFLKLIFLIILILSLYHLIRDILQIFNLDSRFTNILHRPHTWCLNYCDYVTLPLDLLEIVGSFYVLKKMN